jgi:hypothetical protein
MGTSKLRYFYPRESDSRVGGPEGKYGSDMDAVINTKFLDL